MEVDGTVALWDEELGQEQTEFIANPSDEMDDVSDEERGEEEDEADKKKDAYQAIQQVVILLASK